MRKPMEKRCDYDLIDKMLRESKPLKEISTAVKCSISTVYSRKKEMGLVDSRRVAGQVGIFQVARVPVAHLAEQAARATAARLGMDFERFCAEWLPGKIYDPETGFTDTLREGK